jgi:diaminopimelate epimerase
VAAVTASWKNEIMDISFEKWHGCRNDFIILRLTEADGEVVLNSLSRQAPVLCDRHSGIGADGLLVLWTQSRQQIEPTHLTIINSDGSIAQNCGNGLRCAASSVLKALRDHQKSTDSFEMLDLSVEGVSKVCRFMKKNQEFPFVAVEMGVPTLNDELPWWSEAKKTVRKLADELGLEKSIQDLAACDVGNQHLIISCESASRDMMLAFGPKLQKSPHWDGINVHLVSAVATTDQDRKRSKNDLGGELSEVYKAFVWERGAGETLACGSGAVAIAASALASGTLERDQWIAVDMPGGRLYVKQEQDDEPAMLAGPANFIFRGTISI